MAVVLLETGWLCEAANMSNCLGLENVTVFAPETSVQGDVRIMANNRRRAVVGLGSVARNYDVTVTYSRRRDITWLESMAGVLVYFRDPMGRSMYGIYKSVKVSERRGAGEGDVSFTLEEITVDVAV